MFEEAEDRTLECGNDDAEQLAIIRDEEAQCEEGKKYEVSQHPLAMRRVR